MFESPMDLHYSQTFQNLFQLLQPFESPMDLHYSQTWSLAPFLTYKFESPMDLHYSQTSHAFRYTKTSLNPLWIYTTLKQLPKKRNT